MSIAKAAAGERRRAEEALRFHLKGCLSCYRWSKGRQEFTHCDLGPQLTEYVATMRRQEQLLKSPPMGGMVQDTLF